jgi:hypothetical protein
VLLRGSPQGATGYLQAALRDPKLILDRAAGAEVAICTPWPVRCP